MSQSLGSQLTTTTTCVDFIGQILVFKMGPMMGTPHVTFRGSKLLHHVAYKEGLCRVWQGSHIDQIAWKTWKKSDRKVMKCKCEEILASRAFVTNYFTKSHTQWKCIRSLTPPLTYRCVRNSWTGPYADVCH